MSKTPEEIAASIIAEWRKARDAEYPHHEAVLERAIVMELRAERDVIARLTRERDALKSDVALKWQPRQDEIIAERDEAVEALRPFVLALRRMSKCTAEHFVIEVHRQDMARAVGLFAPTHVAARTMPAPSAETLARHRALGDAIDQIGAPESDHG